MPEVSISSNIPARRSNLPKTLAQKKVEKMIDERRPYIKREMNNCFKL